jgi:hypothetical protein
MFSTVRAIQIGQGAILEGRSNGPNMSIGSNFYLDSAAAYRYTYTDYASRYTQAIGTHYWYTAPSGTAGNAITFTQAMTLDASGNLGLGVTPSAWNISALKVFQVSNGSLSANPASVFLGNNSYYTGSYQANYISTAPAQLISLNRQGANDIQFLLAPSGTAGNAITFTQAMTLDSSGNLMVGTTSAGGRLAVTAGTSTQSPIVTSGVTGDTVYQAILVTKFDNNSTTSQNFIQFQINNGGANCGKITANGANTAAFGSTSDQRVKENIADLPSQIANIMALRPVEFDYVESYGGGHQIGFIAQEMQQVYPDVISEDASEEKILSITGWSKTEARLVKAIQELKAEVDSLKSQLNGIKP